MKPKILYLVTSSAWGGAERYVARLALAAAGEFDVAVAAGRSESPQLFDALGASMRTFTLEDLTHPIGPLRDLRAIGALRRLIDAEGFDLIHCNSSKAGLIGALAARRSRRRPKVVYTAHGWGFLERRSLPFRLAVLSAELLSSRFRDATIVLSRAEAAVARRYGLASGRRLHLIPHGIDPDEIRLLDRDEARRRIESASGRRLGKSVIGTIANTYPSKGLPLLLETFGRIAADLPETELVIVGDGPGMAALKDLQARHPHRDRIHLTGAIADAASLLHAFDVFVLASLKEGSPWVILEASLAGVPIVATRVGALPELLEDGSLGLLVAPGDAGALAGALRRVLTDRALLQTLKNGAPRIAERRSAAKMIAATLDLYRSLIAER